MSEKRSFSISGYMKIEAKKSYSGGYAGAIKSFTVSKPALTSNQIAVFIKVSVPIAFFERMTPVVEIELPEEAVVHPDIQTTIKIAAMEVADKLQFDVQAVEDGLRSILEEKTNKLNSRKE